MNTIDINMNKEDINKLIIRFYEGETTEKEECLLRAIFSGEDVPEGFETEREYLLFCLTEVPVKNHSIDLEEKILNAIDKSNGIVSIQKGRRILLKVIGSAAATILILFGVYFFFERRNRITDTYSDPKIAYAETMKILMHVSKQLNKGTQTLKPVGKLCTITYMSIGKVNEKSTVINKSFMKLNSLQKVSGKALNDSEKKK
jgi:hypothetical protein